MNLNHRAKSLKAFRIYIVARRAYARHRFKLAAVKLIKIPVQMQNRDTNYLLVKSLYRSHQYRLASRFLMSAINNYAESPSWARLMVQVLLKDHDFIKCYEIIAVMNDRQLKQRFLLMTQKNELRYQQAASLKIRKIADSFYHLANRSLIRQRQIFSVAMKLPLGIFLKIAKNLLIDPFLNPIMRLSVLEVIRKVGITDQVQYRWLNGKVYSFQVDQLCDLNQMRSYRQVMKIIRLNYSKNPVDTVILKQNLRLELAYLYPFNNVLVRTPRLWVKIANLMVKGEQPVVTNHKVARIYDLQLKLNRLTTSLVK